MEELQAVSSDESEADLALEIIPEGESCGSSNGDSVQAVSPVGGESDAASAAASYDPEPQARRGAGADASSRNLKADASIPLPDGGEAAAEATPSTEEDLPAPDPVQCAAAAPCATALSSATLGMRSSSPAISTTTSLVCRAE